MIRLARSLRGFTLIELMIVVAILAVVAMVAAPSMWRYIEVQRLRSVSSEMVNDLQYARSEAVARGRLIAIRYDANATRTCYTIGAYTATGICPSTVMSTCDCRLGAGSACTVGGAWTEVKTVSVPRSIGVRMEPPGAKRFAFDPTSGNITFCPINMTGAVPSAFIVDTIGGGSGQLRTTITPSGRPSTCATGGSVVGVASC